MITHSPRFARLAAALGMVCIVVNIPCLIASPAVAQSPSGQSNQDDNTYIGYVTTDDVYVRSGPADSYYPFGKVHEGDLITIVGSKFNWAKVRTDRPAFEDFFGYMRVAATEQNRIRLSGNGKELTTLGRTDLLAPNYNTDNNPLDSWKPAAHLGVDRKLRILDTIMKGSETFYKVRMTDDAIGWVNLTYVREATKQEIAAAQKKQEQKKENKDKQNKQTENQNADAKTQADESQTPATDAARKEKQQPESGQAKTPANQSLNDEPDADATSETQDATREQTNASPGDDTNERAGNPQGQTDVLGRDTPQMTPPQRGDAQHTDKQNADASTATQKDAGHDVELTLETLEQRFKTLRKQSILNAEVEPLRRLYLRFASEKQDEPRIRRYAEARAEQLEIWRELQHRQARLAQMREQLKMTEAETQAVQQAMDEQTPYAGVGRLTASTIYNGKGLPRLLRLADPATGRTIAYVQPKKSLELTESLGRLVGIVGDKQYDAGLRLTLIQPKRVDVLTPSR